MNILLAKDMDASLDKGCTIPGCECHNKPQDSLMLSQRCHPQAGLEAEYHRGGLLELRCDKCQKTIAKVMVQ
jgi:hypothetical protein